MSLPSLDSLSINRLAVGTDSVDGNCSQKRQREGGAEETNGDDATLSLLARESPLNVPSMRDSSESYPSVPRPGSDRRVAGPSPIVRNDQGGHLASPKSPEELPPFSTKEWQGGKGLWDAGACFYLDCALQVQCEHPPADLAEVLVTLHRTMVESRTIKPIVGGSFNDFYAIPPGAALQSIVRIADGVSSSPSCDPTSVKLGMRVTRLYPEVDDQAGLTAQWQEAWTTLVAARLGLHPRVYACMRLVVKTGVKTIYVTRRYESVGAMIHKHKNDVEWAKKYSNSLLECFEQVSNHGLLLTDNKPGNLVFDKATSKFFIIDLDASNTVWMNGAPSAAGDGENEEDGESADCVLLLNILLFLISCYCWNGTESGTVALLKPLATRLGALAAAGGMPNSNLCNAVSKFTDATQGLLNEDTFMDTNKIAQHVLFMAAFYGVLVPRRGMSCTLSDKIRTAQANDPSKPILELLIAHLVTVYS